MTGNNQHFLYSWAYLAFLPFIVRRSHVWNNQSLYFRYQYPNIFFELKFRTAAQGAPPSAPGLRVAAEWGRMRQQTKDSLCWVWAMTHEETWTNLWLGQWSHPLSSEPGLENTAKFISGKQGENGTSTQRIAEVPWEGVTDWEVNVGRSHPMATTDLMAFSFHLQSSHSSL